MIAVIAIGIVISLLLWLLAVWMTEPFVAITIFEPLAWLMGSILAVILGERFTERMARITSEPRPVLLEDREDQTARPWRKINHSFPEIHWSPEIEQQHLKELVHFYYKQERIWNRNYFAIFEELIEKTGTINYRIFSILGPARFIRIDKTANLIDLKCRRSVVVHLRETSVFRDEFLRGFEPIAIRTPDLEDERKNQPLHKKTLLSSHFKKDGPVFIQMFPYIDVNMHYTGKDDEELVSVAAAFGRLQSRLQCLDEDKYEQLKKNSKENDLIRPEEDAESLLRLWLKILKAAEDKGPEDLYAQLLKVENKNGRLTEWVEESASLRAKSDENKYLLLHDVHPHNVICKNSECVLIYDYSWIGSWRHSLVVAFSLHRFVREYLIRNSSESDIMKIDESQEQPPWVKDLCKKGAYLFLSSYREHCGQDLIPLPDDFETELGKYIRSSNMGKMFGIFQDGLGLNDDIRMRPEARNLGEARKFVRFMKESEAFRL